MKMRKKKGISLPGRREWDKIGDAGKEMLKVAKDIQKASVAGAKKIGNKIEEAHKDIKRFMD